MHSNKNALEVFELIKAASETDDMITAGTPSSAGGDRDRSAVGIAQGHAYSVLSAHIVTDSQNQVKRLIRVRNPWGSEDYEGPYSDSDSTKWDPTLQAAVEYVDADDGAFYIDYESFHREFDETTISYDTANLKQSYILVQDDSTSDGLHKFTIKSVED